MVRLHKSCPRSGPRSKNEFALCCFVVIGLNFLYRLFCAVVIALHRHGALCVPLHDALRQHCDTEVIQKNHALPSQRHLRGSAPSASCRRNSSSSCTLPRPREPLRTLQSLYTQRMVPMHTASRRCGPASRLKLHPMCSKLVS